MPLPRASTSSTSLDTVSDAAGKEFLVRGADVQMLHGFQTAADAKAYLPSELFTRDVVSGLTPAADTAPDVRVYDAARTEESVNVSLEPLHPDVRKQGLAHAVPPTAAQPEEAPQ